MFLQFTETQISHLNISEQPLATGYKGMSDGHVCDTLVRENELQQLFLKEDEF